MSEFRKFVQLNDRWFKGRFPETDTSLDDAEQRLRIRLPADLRWLLRNYGYWHATGIGSLRESVATTEAWRKYVGLPAKYFVLNDLQDAGCVILDTVPYPESGQHRVYWIGRDMVPDRITMGKTFESYLAYAQDELLKESDFIAEEDIDYDPKRYRDV